MIQPAYVRPGEAPTASWANSIVSAIRSIATPTKPKRMRGAGGGDSGYIPWKPRFFKDDETFKCNFNLGTINNVAASNWNDDFTLPSDDSAKFVVLTVTAESGKVTSVVISLDSSAPATDTVTKDAPPASFKILLGAVGKSSGQMIIATNLDKVGVEVFRETRSAPAVGGEAFHRWWRWN